MSRRYSSTCRPATFDYEPEVHNCAECVYSKTYSKSFIVNSISGRPNSTRVRPAFIYPGYESHETKRKYPTIVHNCRAKSSARPSCHLNHEGVRRGGSSGGGGGGGWGPVAEHLLRSTTQESHGTQHRHDTENEYENTLSERISSLRIDDGHGGGGGGGSRFEDEIQEPNPQQPTVDDAADTICAGTRGNLHDSSSGLFSDRMDTSPPKTTAQKSKDGLFAIPEVPHDSRVSHSSSQDLQVDFDSFSTPQVDISINSRDTLVDNEPKTVLLTRSKSSREPEDIKQCKTRLLACPYPKHAPEIYGHRCRAAAFSQIHRLKEHLYRVHKQPPHCVRCGEKFTNESDVKAHLGRPDEICDFVADVSVDGLSSEQIKQLRSKKRKPGVSTNEEKWRDIFEIVFPDATEFPDPYYSSFDNRSNDRTLLSMGQSDVVSIFSNVPPESEDRMFTNLEQICGPLEKSKRRKVWNAVQNFFVERVQQIMGNETIFQNSRDAVHPHESSPASVSFQTAAPETEERIAETQWPTKQKYSMDPGQTVLGTTSTIGDVETLQTDLLQDHLECNLFNLPNEQILNHEIAGIENEARLNKCANAGRPVSISSSGMVSDRHAFDTLAPCENLSSLLQPYEEFFDLDSILNEATDGSEHVDFTLADWPTGHSNL